MCGGPIKLIFVHVVLLHWKKVCDNIKLIVIITVFSPMFLTYVDVFSTLCTKGSI